MISVSIAPTHLEALEGELAHPVDRHEHDQQLHRGPKFLFQLLVDTAFVQPNEAREDLFGAIAERKVRVLPELYPRDRSLSVNGGGMM